MSDNKAEQVVTPLAASGGEGEGVSAVLKQAPPAAAKAAEAEMPWQLVIAINLVVFGTIAWFAWAKGALSGYGWWSPWAYWIGLLTVVGSLGVGAWSKSNGSRQVLVLTVVVVPILLSVVVGIVFLPPQWQFGLIRTGFILVACLLPAAMYYLFVVTRKGSLLNEFVANTDRLGLLDQQRYPGREGTVVLESEIARSRRIEAYLQKFEAVFGPIADERVRDNVLSNDPKVAAEASKAMRVGVAAVFLSEAAVPVLAATFLTALFWVVTLPPIGMDLAHQLLGLSLSASQADPLIDAAVLPWWEALRPNLFPASAAFLGAYYYSLQFLFYRYIRRDLRPSAYVSVVRRILISVIAVWLLEGIANLAGEQLPGEYLVLAGFVVGVFPRVFLQLLETAWKKAAPSVKLPSFESNLPIAELDGLTLWHEARLEEEDVDNIPNVATADLLELMINTRFPANRLVDWVDQAILFTCLGAADKDTRREKLRRHGIRTATALTETYRMAITKDRDREEYERLLGSEPRSEIRALADVIDTMPNTRLIRVWRGLNAEGFRKALAPA